MWLLCGFGVLVAIHGIGEAGSRARSFSPGASPELALRAGRPSMRAWQERSRRLDPARDSAFRHVSGEPHRIWAGAPPDTGRLLVILAEFPLESPDDPNTTGNGRFQLDPSTEYPTNQPPHDHAYFDRQCRALASYFEVASDGRYALEWEFFPPTGDPSPFIVMPQRMRYYNPDTTETALNRRLAEFFRDAVTTADARGATFSAHDYVVVFHAGVGQDLLIDESTPSDLVSAFLSFEELRDYLGEPEDYEGIAVEGGTFHVREGLWLPETENQEGFEFAITGVFAQLMGSQLGLPILWNPDSGAPGIGRFGLMDQGGGNELGKVPALPCAWSRFDLGWADLAIVPNGQDVEVRARGALGGGADLVYVPVDEREFFLIENRHRDVNGDGELEVLFEETVPIGVADGEYDFGIPGSGLLVWHIDQAVILAERAANRVNADFRHRGVKLLEADGLDEIGLYPVGGFGLAADAFRGGHNTELTPTSHPSSRSNYAGAWTNVFVTGVSDSGLVMRCDIESRGFLVGWPDSSSRGIAPIAPSTGDVDGDGEVELVIADSVSVSVFGASATSGGREVRLPYEEIRSLVVADLVPGNGRDEIVLSDVLGRLRVFVSQADTLAAIAELLPASPIREGARHPMQPLVSASPAFGGPELEVFAARNDSCYIWSWSSPSTIDRVSFLAPYFTTSLLYATVRGLLDDVDVLMADENGLFVGYTLEELRTYGDAGRLTPLTNLRVETRVRPSRSPVVGDLDRDGVAEVVLLGLDGTLSVFDLTGPVGGQYGLRLRDGWPVTLEANASAPALGDIDGNGYPEILVGEIERVQALSRNGKRLEGWPVTLSPFDDDTAPLAIVTQSLIADVDRDGSQDVIVSAPDGVLRAFAGNGRPVDGWPRVAGRTHLMTPVITAFGGGSLVAAAVDGDWLYALRLPSAHLGAHWPVLGGDAGRTSTLDSALLAEVGGAPGHFSPDEMYVYPNPAFERARVRYYVREDSDVVVTVFDATGLRVVEIDATAVGGAVNEVDWDLRNEEGKLVSSGLYLVRITARDGANVVTHDTRLAVAR
jgi:M6 family metalloprotease-like protein